MYKASLLVPVILAATVGGCDSSKPSSSAAETCARFAACGLAEAEGDSVSLGECRYAVEAFEAILSQSPSSPELKVAKSNLDCVRAASTCDQVRACNQPTSAQLAICQDRTEDTCSGNVMVLCGSGNRITAVDCAKSGLVCGASEYGAACGLASCDPTTTQPRCEGNRLITCDEYADVLTGDDCAIEGRTCGSNPLGETACVGSKACNPATATTHCDGNAIVHCDAGTEARTDCAAVLGDEWTCRVQTLETGTWTRCVPVAQECTVGEGESCGSGVVTYCHAGRKTTFDCRSLGFSGCREVTTETTVANCVE
jgi:hypothetical protein